jgi:hypothetical protein
LVKLSKIIDKDKKIKTKMEIDEIFAFLAIVAEEKWVCIGNGNKNSIQK